jgi:hypothetical protein
MAALKHKPRQLHVTYLFCAPADISPHFAKLGWRDVGMTDSLATKEPREHKGEKRRRLLSSSFFALFVFFCGS